MGCVNEVFAGFRFMQNQIVVLTAVLYNCTLNMVDVIL